VAPVLLCAGTAPAGDGTAATGADSPRTLSIGGKVLAEYRYTGVPYKPYISVFRTPAGINVLRDAPADHLHHHALMFAIAVDGIDFWQEGNAPGRQVHREFLKSGDASSRQETAQFVERLDWLAPETETPLLHEKRSVRIFDPLHFGASLMTWETELSVPEGRESAALTGSHYFGLGMRFLESMDNDGIFFNADNATGDWVRGDEHVTRSRWCAYTSLADGKPVTVAMFDSPDNPRHPAWWFTMSTPFDYISATLNLYREPMELKAGAPLRLRYGVALWDGHVGAAEVEAMYQKWRTAHVSAENQ
jgi:hypothetical protein